MQSLLFLVIIGTLESAFSSALNKEGLQLNVTVEDFSQLKESGERSQKKECRSVAGQMLPLIGRKVDLCGNPNREDDFCVYGCVSGGFYHGLCSSANECFCYNNNPEKGFIIERKQPVMRRVKSKNGNQNQKEIAITSDDYTTGYVDVDVQLNLEWDLSYINEWFQSFNSFGKGLVGRECDPCLCPVGCAMYGHFSGYCTPKPAVSDSNRKTECMCATPSRKPQ